LHNEESCVKILYAELEQAFAMLYKSYEVLFIDDGSNDHTAEIIKQICEKNKNIHLISFSKRFGLSAALAAGISSARGDVVVCMDGDLQNKPDDMHLLLSELSKGYDMVCGYRKKRKDALISRCLPSFITNRLGMLLFGLRIHDFSTTYKACKKHVLKDMKFFNGAHRFMPVLAKQKNMMISEVVISHRPRTTGVSKFGFATRLVKVFKDAILLKISNSCPYLGFSVFFKDVVFEIKYKI
jgi:glycosyltransferase involved in cell wall biosynthesis